MAGNEGQIEFWNGEAGQRWVEHDAELERAIGVLTPRLLARAGTAARRHALDIGCGCGNQTLALARQLGAGARVTGVDISAPMLALARTRAAAAPADAAVLDFLHLDAAAHAFPPGTFDLLFSRFGVMFFVDPLAAFRNLRAACAPGATLVFCCWQAPARNDWISLPMQAVAPHAGAPAATDPYAPGPFAFADSERVGGILAAAGFADIAFEPFETELCFAQGATLAAAVDALLQTGPVGTLLAPLEPGPRERALADARTARAPSYRDGGLWLRSAAWIVHAQAC